MRQYEQIKESNIGVHFTYTVFLCYSFLFYQQASYKPLDLVTKQRYRRGSNYIGHLGTV